MSQLRFWLLLACFCIPSLAQAQPATVPAPKYAPAVKALEAYIEREVEQKHLPSLSIALVDDQQVIWARGFGFADRERKKPASADTVYRVGSVSKTFTDIALMQLAERGDVDIDAPIAKYLPDFKPLNSSGKPITLRNLMAHRSGLMREPPVGSYFHGDAPSVAKTVASLNGIPLQCAPESKSRYSNAGITVVGYVLEKLGKQPYSKTIREHVLEPLGMKNSDFEPRPDVINNRAGALMWTYHGREFPAPTFELGLAPAGGLYSTANDLARFLTAVFADGKEPAGSILKPETLREMQTPQLVKEGETTGFGLGFSISELDGKKRVGHGGAVYGFSTDVSFLPNEKLGVVVLSSRDFTNPLVSHIATTALRHMLAVKNDRPLPTIPSYQPIKADEARVLAGRYACGDKVFDLEESLGRLYYYSIRGGARIELHHEGSNLVTDDVLGIGMKIERVGEKLRIGKDDYSRLASEKPAPCPSRFLGLVGEYGWDHNTLFVFEKDGKLHCNLYWLYIYPLTEKGNDTFVLPDFGFFPEQKLVFKRDKNGKAQELQMSTVLMKRRPIDGEDGNTFRIKPVRPVEQLRKEAAAASPPPERGKFRPAELVELTSLDKGIKLDLRYATDNNFMSVPLYPSTAKAYMQKPAAEALSRVNAKLKEKGYGLLIHDAYRPWAVTKMFWDATPEKWHHFVADPSKGSRHNRGCAVDLTLYELKTGKPVEMVGGFDEFSDRSYPDYVGGTSLQRWHRELLRRMMGTEGFSVYEAEWWHFDYEDWGKYAIGNQSFEELEKKR